MLGSISLLGERARQRRWSVTVGALAAGAIAAGALLGASLGLIGRLVPLTDSVSIVLLLLALGTAAVVDLLWLPRKIGPVRQVNDQWLAAYRGWVAGAGFGFQLGGAVATVVNSASTYATLVVMVLVHDIRAAVLIGIVYGGVRAATVLAGGFIRTSADLARIDSALVRADGPIRYATAAATLICIPLVLVSEVKFHGTRDDRGVRH